MIEASRAFRVICEGIDGSGKDSAVDGLREIFEREKVPYFKSSEPNRKTEIGKIIDRALKAELVLEPLALQMLFMANRREVFIEEASYIARGINILKPRSFMSTYAHVRGIDPEAILAAHRALLPECENFDVAFIMKIRPEVAIARMQSDNRGTEIFENLSMLTETAGRYDSLAGIYGDRVVRVDTEQNNKSQVAELI